MHATRLFACLILLPGFLLAQDEADRRPGVTTDRMMQVEQSARSVPLIPTPQETYWGHGEIILGRAGKFEASIELPRGADDLSLLRSELEKRITTRTGALMAAGAPRIIFALNPTNQPEPDRLAARLRSIGPEGYVITTTSDTVFVTGNSGRALWHGMVSVAGLIRKQGDQLLFPRLEIVDYPRMDDRALLAEIGGQGYMVGPSRWHFDQWKEFVDWMVDHKFNTVWLEFIGSGRLMGNLDMNAGEWVGFPLALKSYPQLVGRDRPIKRWDESQQKVVEDRYTIPNVAHEFVHELIDYAQARGIRCHLLIGYDYFANQLPVTLHLPANDPQNPAANKFYDAVLTEIVQRYSNASGVVLHTIENKDIPPTMLDAIMRRAHDADRIIKSINPKMQTALLADFLEWRPQAELERLKAGLPPDMAFAYAPHREPEQKAWKRIVGDVWRYSLYSQYAWDHIVYIMREQVREEALASYADGYRRMVSQMWYFDVFQVNYLALAEFSWNPTSGTAEAFWDKALDEVFGRAARDAMRAALAHTRFDLRFDIIGRMIVRPNIQSPFSFWDMYRMSRYDGLNDSMLAELEADARASLEAARTALPLAVPASRDDVQMVITSAERRLYLATSARHLVKALQLKKDGQIEAAVREMDQCIAEGAKMESAATRLGIEFPMAVHDAKILARYREVRASLR